MVESLDNPTNHFDVKKIRNNFPILNRKINNHDLVYLDNASTTQKPKVVIDALTHYYQNNNANIHRGVYQLSQEATSQYEETREIVAQFINAPSSCEVIFTKNTTESLNLIAYSWGRKNVEEGDNILLTQMEHHSNIVPWQILAQERQALLNYLPITQDGRLILNNLSDYINSQTKLVSLTHVSNVLGTINPVNKIITEIKKINPNVVVVIDGAQAAGHMKVDVKDLGADFYVFSAHKMLGSTGVGVLWGREELLEKMEPFLTGGDMIETVSFKESTWNKLPWKFEAGTPNIADVIAFKASLNYLEKVGLTNIEKYEKKLTSYALQKLAEVPTLKIYGSKDTIDRAAVISFNVGKTHAHDLASLLDGSGICIRSGHHCAQPLLSNLGVNSTARASFYLYNTTAEIDKLVSSLISAQEVLNR